MPQIVGGDLGQCLIYLRKYHLDWSNKYLKNCIAAAVRGPMKANKNLQAVVDMYNLKRNILKTQ